MEKKDHQFQLPNWVGPPLLFLGMCVYAGSGPLFKKMAIVGNRHHGGDTNTSEPELDMNNIQEEHALNGVPSSKITISPCNVLFVGNLLATVVTAIPFREDLTRTKFQALSRRQWIGLLTVTMLQTSLARFGELYAIAICPQDKIVPLSIIGRLEPPMTFILCRLVFHRHQKQSIHAYVGNFLSVLGVVVALAIVPLLRGTFRESIVLEPLLLTFGATVLDAIGAGFSFTLLQDVPVGIYLIIRSGIGAIFFFAVAWGLFGIHHFAGCWRPEVLEYMLAWSGGYILFGNLCWFTGVSRATPLQISMVGAFYLPMGLIFTWLLLQCTPTDGQFAGAAIIVFACVYSIFCKPQESSNGDKKDDKLESSPFLINEGALQEISQSGAVEDSVPKAKGVAIPSSSYYPLWIEIALWMDIEDKSAKKRTPISLSGQKVS